MLGVAVGDRQAGLLVVRAGADLLVAAGADPGHHADHHLLVPARGHGGGQPCDLREVVDDDAADAEAQRRLEVAR
ncbi:hypothetical protein GCM10010145_67450 [Streptomyces ruber]|uniref:Uncharacterized protein n=2 Tax=Streptomyces TaxID=1883 RepID=A0A918F060_9ACTN|nr:hypothetical protein GCM10010145_67450 [Streptomyces ruber]